MLRSLTFGLVASLVSIAASADGIPVPMDQQTPYNWKCANGATLHLMANENGRDTLFIQDGANVGTTITPKVAQALIKKQSSSLNKQKVEDKQFNRSITFFSEGGVLSVVMQDRKPDYAMYGIHCSAQF